MTCKPWKPVATKKVDPYTESAIQKGASKYSIACKAVNSIPNIIVKTKPLIASSLLPLIIAWWAQVTVAPELNNIAVLSKGTEKGFNTSIPWGGHIVPISMAGAKLLWKNAQKKEKKKQTSEAINNNIPNFNPFLTMWVW